MERREESWRVGGEKRGELEGGWRGERRVGGWMERRERRLGGWMERKGGLENKTMNSCTVDVQGVDVGRRKPVYWKE